MDKIENLNLIALRKYACPKINSQKDWYLKCVECDYLNDCKVGKRAVEIIESETKPLTEPEVPEKNNHDRFIEAAKQPDPAKWLFENGYYSKRWRANDAWKKWVSHHGGTIPEPRDGRGGNNNGPLLREKARERVRELIAGNPDEKEMLERILEKSPNLTASSVSSRLYTWLRDYSDILGDYPPVHSLSKKMSAFAKKKKTAKEAYDSMFGNDQPAEKEDEVSLEDFLKETEEPSEPATDEEPAPVSGDKSEEAPAEVTPTPEQLVIQKQFGLKKQILRKRIGYLQDEISKLTDEAAKIQAQMDILDAAAELFGMRPASAST